MTPGRVTVGRVGRPHGLGGSFVVEAPSADPDRFAPGARVYVRGEQATVLEAKRAGSRLVVRLDRPVERGVPLEIPTDELPELPEGEYYAFQLVGLAVEAEDGTRLGRVSQVSPGVANDVLELDTGLALPLVEEWVREVDVAHDRVVVVAGYVGS